eukprot:TRINITY_DN65941_c0_g1_i1.p1 TRINITY_DN65941_c0_g1~~TRINITY_DN65941_c0_g1_i1.p1  ORF type:complete len:427 (+),score=160.79 TRINITY_DN65941_c0_g1_i1:50-1282(+)
MSCCSNTPHQAEDASTTGGYSTLEGAQQGAPSSRNTPPLEGDDVRILVCVDGHDKTRHGAGDFLQWMMMNQPHMHPRWDVNIFGHVHNNTSVPLVRKIGEALGAVTNKAEREKQLRSRMSALQQVVAKSPSVKVNLSVDGSERSMVHVYADAVRDFSPHFIFINERTDSDSMLSPFGTESLKLHHTLYNNNASIVLCKSRVASDFLDPQDPEGLTMHFILLVDVDFSASSVKALESVRSLLPEGGGGAGYDEDGLEGEEGDERVASNGVAFVSVLSCWSMPDVATAMYSTDDRWHHEKKKRRQAARKAANRALEELRQTHPELDATVHTSCDSVSHSVNKIIKVVEKAQIPCFHNVVLGGGRAVIGDDGNIKRERSFSGMMGRAKMRAFGTTADSVVKHVDGAGAVTIAY